MIRSMCPEEYPITLYLNEKAIATYQLTKQDLEDWAIGYLFTEGIIDSLNDLKGLQIFIDRNRIYAELTSDFDLEVFMKRKKNFTAGCGTGLTFFSMTDIRKFSKVESNIKTTLSYLLKKRTEFAQKSPMYLETGGMHGACLVELDGKITVREDIGRHNAVDKIIGFALRQGLDPKNLILITTGRISYEMLSKSARFGIGVLGSRTAATKQAVQLAKFLNIDVVGYIRGKMATIYTTTGRIQDDLKEVVFGQLYKKGGIS